MKTYLTFCIWCSIVGCYLLIAEITQNFCEVKNIPNGWNRAFIWPFWMVVAILQLLIKVFRNITHKP